MQGRKWGICDKDSLAGKCNLGCYFIFCFTIFNLLIKWLRLVILGSITP
jgi:hypothetical protein